MSSVISNDYSARFAGIGRLYGIPALMKFQRAHICVVGIGGVGSWSAEALARSGVGNLTLFDLDDICVSNTNRQVHTLTGSVGRMKAEVMAQRVLEINTECNVMPETKFVTEKNVAEVIDNRFDYIIDATDSVRHKSAMIAHCRRNKIKIITVGGAGGQVDPTQIQVTDLSRTYHDPLLAKVRKRLRQHFRFSSNPGRRFAVEAVFSTEQLVYPQSDGSVCPGKPEQTDSMRLDCAGGFGAATSVTATFGFVAAARVLKKISA